MSLDKNWEEIRATLDSAVSIAWDTCHKIYLLMDEGQHNLMAEYGYDPLVRVADVGAETAYEMLRVWWDESCGLRFVYSVRTVSGNANDGFNNLISQFEDDEFED